MLDRMPPFSTTQPADVASDNLNSGRALEEARLWNLTISGLLRTRRGNVVHTLLFRSSLGPCWRSDHGRPNHAHPAMMILAADRSSNRELSGQFLRRRHVLQLHIVG
jgi:hypothetical protein